MKMFSRVRSDEPVVKRATRRWAPVAFVVGMALFAGMAFATVVDSTLFVAARSVLYPMGCLNGAPSIGSGAFGPLTCSTDGGLSTTVLGPLGQDTMDNSIPVVIASDYPGFTVNPATSGGLSWSHTLSAGSTNSTAVKASAGQIYSVSAFSLDATPVYIKFYNKATAPTCNTDTIVAQFMIPANSTAANGGGYILPIPYGFAFSTGIGFCITTGIAANDTGAVTASEVLLEIGYK